jgi:6,7-dimethyl-8-ribityllumazine synthase
VAAVVSRFHDDLTGPMLASARKELAASGVRDRDMRVVWVPGSFELPLVARALAAREDVDAVLCLGIILRGETDHDIYVAEGAVQGLMQATLETGKPLLLGILTCETIEQARARALPRSLGGEEDTGREVARSAMEMLAALDEARSTAAVASGGSSVSKRRSASRKSAAPKRAKKTAASAGTRARGAKQRSR